MPQLHAPRMERPPRIRSMITLEIASEILARSAAVGPETFATRIQLRQQTQDFDEWFATIVSGDGRQSLTDVAEGRADLAIVAPADVAAFAADLPVQCIASVDDCALVCSAGAPADVIAAFRAAAERFRPASEDQS
jgi:hypothetical protein